MGLLLALEKRGLQWCQPFYREPDTISPPAQQRIIQPQVPRMLTLRNSTVEIPERSIFQLHTLILSVWNVSNRQIPWDWKYNGSLYRAWGGELGSDYWAWHFILGDKNIVEFFSTKFMNLRRCLAYLKDDQETFQHGQCLERGSHLRWTLLSWSSASKNGIQFWGNSCSIIPQFFTVISFSYFYILCHS